MKENNLNEDNLNNNNSKENKVKIKLKEYFTKNKVLIHKNFNQFLEFIGLKEIWSTKKEQNFLWETITAYAKDKKNIEYDATLLGISNFFEEDDEKNSDDINDDNINTQHIKLNDSNDLNILNNEKCIDEFLNTINNNQETLYNIRFINEIFFNKYINKKDDIIINDEKIKIKSDEIIDKIKLYYKFINISVETLKEYLNYIEDKKIINNNENEYYLNKDLISYVNAIIDLKIEDNIQSHNINLNNSNITNNNINGNSVELSIEKLSLLDKNIINCLDGIQSLHLNSDFIKLMRKYIENYILYLRQSIYNELKTKELEMQQRINQTNNTCNICNKDIDKENKKLNMTTFLRKNSKFKYKLNKESRENRIIEINEIMKNNSSTNLRNSLSMPREQTRNDTQLNIASNKGRSYYSKMSTDNIFIFQPEHSKNRMQSQNKMRMAYKSTSPTYSSIEGNMDDITYSKLDVFSNTGNANGDQIFLETNKLEEENLSNKNNNIINSSNISRNLIKKTTSIKKQNRSNNNIDLYSDKNNESSFKINNEDNFDDFENYDRNSFYSRSNNSFFIKKNLSIKNRDYYLNGNYDIRNSDVNLYQSIKTIDNCYGTINYGPINEQLISNLNQKFSSAGKFSKKDSYSYYYDFEYLGYSHRVKNIFSLNHEKVCLEEFFSEDINAYFSKTNKQNYKLIITSFSFYFLKPETLECVLRIALKELESMTISSKNANLLLLSFKDKAETDIIIESFQRMEILIFLKKVMSKNDLDKEIKVNMSNKFILRNKNGKQETVLTFKNKIFNLTPNFENAQKIAILLKYQENIFRATFIKKLVVLCSIGLIYFNDGYTSPKTIIPIIGTSIRLIVVQYTEKIYCLKLTTINGETFIFGSLVKNQILDWKKELLKYKKAYDIQMKTINPDCSRKSSKVEDKENDDIFSRK